ncbi:MAG: ribosome biogenesis GTP-binding protein YihA/YsxC [Woeseiaceae bacterium]|nr:ribosome biogenesis GTP-binding protein YihA/YsxC [Woeseiaceae bacterium]
MSQFPDAKFILSAASPQQFPADRGSEVAVAGRSNAGKSSAINAIVNRRQLAKTGKTPGRTQLINFFELGKGQRLVDLPGYGFARVHAEVRRNWSLLLESYFEGRASLKGLLLVVDCRRGLGEFDLTMLAFADDRRIPVHVLLTKADKLNKKDAAASLQQAQAQLGASASVQLFSALRQRGLEESREALLRFLGTERRQR